MMYRATFKIRIDRKNLTKIEEMLKERWKATNISSKEISKNCWLVSFRVEDHRKLFAFKEVIENYDGKLLRPYVRKEEKIHC